MFGTFALSFGAAVSSIYYVYINPLLLNSLHRRVCKYIQIYGGEASGLCIFFWVILFKNWDVTYLNFISGGNGVLGKMGTQSAVARFVVAHARGRCIVFTYL